MEYEFSSETKSGSRNFCRWVMCVCRFVVGIKITLCKYLYN